MAHLIPPIHRSAITNLSSSQVSLQLTGAGLAASSLGALGFGYTGEALAAAVRPFKLTATTETRNTCTYCSVACGILIYSMGDRAKNARSNIIHIEGDPDHPVNRGTLWSKRLGVARCRPCADPVEGPEISGAR